MAAVFGSLFIVLGVAAFIAFIAILRGFALSYLWQWFITPFGLPELGIAHAIGISMIVGFLTYQHNGSEEANKGVLAVTFLSPLMALFFGYIVHSFM